MKTFNIINNQVSEVFEIPVSDITGKSKVTETLFARYAAMFIARNCFNLTFKAIGMQYGGRDHSTVIAALRVIETLRNTNRIFESNLYKSIEQVNKHYA